MPSLLKHALVKLLIVFEGGANINVTVVNLCAGTLHHQMGEFQALHTADAGAIFIVVLIAAAHTVNDNHRFWRGLHVTPHNSALGGTRRVAHAFEFEAGEYIRPLPITPLREPRCAEQTRSRSQ